jgi:ubiquinone/menaquinone biosynthesis C-methylase UbiE
MLMSRGDAHKQRVVEVFGQSATTYDEEGASLFPPAARWLVAATGVHNGDRVLDVATGTGQVLFVSARVVGAEGRVIWIGLTDEMLAYARVGIATEGIINAEVRVMDAERLELPEASFDTVLCSFGLMFFPEPDRALAEIQRVLRPGGAFGATTFAANLPMAWQRDLLRSLGVPRNEIVTEPFSSTDRIRTAFVAAGFDEIQVTQSDAPAIYPDEEAWWRAQWHGGRRAVMDAMDDTMLARYKATAFERLRDLRASDEIRIPRPIHVIAARRKCD